MQRFFLAISLVMLSGASLSLPSIAAAEQAIAPREHLPTPPPEDALWVAPNGSDSSGDGSLERPFRTPGRASQVPHAQHIALLPGVYREFGVITQGGTPASPLTIAGSVASETIILLQDTAQPAEIRASHLRLEGLTLSGRELETPGDCLRIGSDITDLDLTALRFERCGTGVQVGSYAWNHAQLQDVTFTETADIAFDCGRGSCQSHRLNRVLIEGGTSTQGAGAAYGERSRQVLWRDVIIRRSLGDGARFIGPRPSITNSIFEELEGTSLLLERGGYLARTRISTPTKGLFARIGADLTLERTLVHGTEPEAEPFHVLPATQHGGELLIAYSRIHEPSDTLALGNPQDQHTVTLQDSVFWMPSPDSTVSLPRGTALAFADLHHTPAISRIDELLLQVGEPHQDDLFSPLFVGGRTTHHPSGARTITSGSQIRGTLEGEIYVLGEEVDAHLLQDEAQRQRWYPYDTTPDTLSPDILGSLVRGDDVTEPAGTLVKTPTRPQVFVVGAPNSLHWLANETLAEAYAGPRWSTSIVTLSDDQITQYQEGAPLLTQEHFASRALLRQVADPADLFTR
ncbi:MAG: hypothetical protein QG668_153 [Patescibacteria group bacterium]|nr:hypothetical protein [Patescibacteria group bacterium]